MNKKQTLKDFFVSKFASGSLFGAGITAIVIHYFRYRFNIFICNTMFYNRFCNVYVCKRLRSNKMTKNTI